MNLVIIYLFIPITSLDDELIITIIDVLGKKNRLFHWYGGHSELIRFKEYYGMPMGGGHLLSIYVHFLMPAYQFVLMPPGRPIILLK